MDLIQQRYWCSIRWCTLCFVVFGCGGGGSTESPIADAEVMPDQGADMTVVVVDEGVACECVAESECTDEGECEVCSSDSECNDGRICEEMACVNGCVANEDCVEEGTPVCVAGRCAECGLDEDCFGASACVDGACVEPEQCTDSRECFSGRLCIGTLCAEEPDCNTNFECPQGQDCREDGQCIPGNGDDCVSDDECPRIGDVCLQFSRGTGCGPCRDDDDCGEDFQCRQLPEGARCVERAGCISDNQCLNGRICMDGDCVPPPCTDDTVEPNDSLEAATEVGPSLQPDLVSCSSNEDWYRFELAAEHAATVQIRQNGLDGDLTLSAYNEDGQVLATSATTSPNETLVVGPVPTALTVFVRVYQAGASKSVETYSLSLTIEDAREVCVDDAVDNSLGDDDRNSARSVRSAGQLGFDEDQLSGVLCPDDVDVFCFEMQTGETLSASLTVMTGDPTIVGRLLRPDGEEIGTPGRWTRTGDPLDIEQRASAGRWCIELSAESGQGGYTLNLSALDLSQQDACEDVTIINWAGVAQPQVGQLSTNDESQPLCAPDSNGGEARYELILDENDELPLLVTATVEGTRVGNGTLGDPVLSVRTRCADAASELACSTSSIDPNDPQTPRVNPAHLKFLAEEPGSYFITVDGRDVGDAPNFTLTVNAVPAAPSLGAHDRCDLNTPDLPLIGGNATFAVNLDQANDFVASCAGLNGPEAVYRVTFEEPSFVRVHALAADRSFAVGASLLRSCDELGALACGYGFETRVEAGTHYLVIEGVDDFARGQVTVEMLVAPLGAVPNNETCASAEAIPADEVIVGSTALAADDYTFPDGNACTSYNTRAPDVVYEINPPQNERIFVRATPVDGWDLSLYAYSDCSDIFSATDRIECAVDGALTESIMFDSGSAETPIFVFVDGSNDESGEFELSWGVVGCQSDDECPQGTCNLLNYQCE